MASHMQISDGAGGDRLLQDRQIDRKTDREGERGGQFSQYILLCIGHIKLRYKQSVFV